MSGAATQEAQALEALGRDLVAVNWKPQAISVQTFGQDRPPENRLRDLALAYLSENESFIRTAICRGSSVKIEISSSGTAASAVADALLASGGIFISVTSLANVLCIFGLTKFCEKSKAEARVFDLGAERKQ